MQISASERYEENCQNKQFLRHNEEKVTLNDYYSTVKQIDTNDNKG